jgi:hypothetical protein
VPFHQSDPDCNVLEDDIETIVAISAVHIHYRAGYSNQMIAAG